MGLNLKLWFRSASGFSLAIIKTKAECSVFVFNITIANKLMKIWMCF